VIVGGDGTLNAAIDGFGHAAAFSICRWELPTTSLDSGYLNSIRSLRNYCQRSNPADRLGLGE